MASQGKRQKTVVVGAGPVGALAALYAAQRDHDVEIYELRSGTFSIVLLLVAWRLHFHHNRFILDYAVVYAGFAIQLYPESLISAKLDARFSYDYGGKEGWSRDQLKPFVCYFPCQILLR